MSRRGRDAVQASTSTPPARDALQVEADAALRRVIVAADREAQAPPGTVQYDQARHAARRLVIEAARALRSARAAHRVGTPTPGLTRRGVDLPEPDLDVSG